MVMLVLRKCSVVFAVVWLLGTERGDFYAHGRALDGFCAAMGGDGERYVLLLVRSLSSGWCLAQRGGEPFRSCGSVQP
jgi:hypothetical protein